MSSAIKGQASALDYSLLGSIEFQEREFSVAETHLEKALSLDPDLPGTRLTLAQLRDMRGNREGALAVLLDAKKRHPEDPRVLYALGAVCLEMDLVKDANANLARAMQLDPKNVQTRYAYASARIADHDLPGAISLYKQLVTDDSGNAQVRYALGAAYFLAGNRDLANASFEESIRLAPEQVESYYYLGLIAHDEGNEQRSIALFQKVLTRNPEHARAHVALAMDYRAAGRLEDARSELEKAVRADPKSQKAHYQLGLVLTALHHAEQGKSELEIASKLRTNSEDKVSWELAPNR